MAGDISFRSNAQLLDLQLPSFGNSGVDGDDGALFTVEQNEALVNRYSSVVATSRSFMIGGVNAQNSNPTLRRIDLSIWRCVRCVRTVVGFAVCCIGPRFVLSSFL